MGFLRPPPAIASFGLRAMKMVATADGHLADTERLLLATIQGVFGAEVAIDALFLPAYRRQIVRGMVLLSLIDGEASPAESAVVERFARALEIESKDIVTLRHLADKHLVRARASTSSAASSPSRKGASAG